VTRSFRVILAGLAAGTLGGCMNTPDLGTPQAAADAFVRSINTDDMKLFEKVVGDGAIAGAVAECEQKKKGPKPERPSMSDPFASITMPFYKVDMSLWSQDCSTIRADLVDFLKVMSTGPGIHVIEVGSSEKKDGQEQVQVELGLPSEDRGSIKFARLWLVRDERNQWVPHHGLSTLVGNITFALPSTWYALKKLDQALRSK
jgi:hypothetical protein